MGLQGSKLDKHPCFNSFSLQFSCVMTFYVLIFRVLKLEWIYAKYKRLDFQDPNKQNEYIKDIKEGVLMKRGKENQKYKPRRFVLSRHENTLTYYNKDSVSMHAKSTFSIDFFSIYGRPVSPSSSFSSLFKFSNLQSMSLIYEIVIE